MWIFLGPFGLRSGWRVFLWGFCLLISSIPLGILAGDPAELGLHGRLLVSASSLAIALLVTWGFMRLVDRRALRDVGFPGGAPRAAGATGAGTVLGIGCIGAGFLLLLVTATVTVAPSDDPVGSILVALLFLLAAAAFEEVIFRGYPFQWLVRSLGFWPVALGSSVMFGLAHLGNPGVTAPAFVLVVLAGILLALARAVSGDLWLPTGLHFGWNAAQGVLLGLPVSGLTEIPSLAESRLEGPPIWSGAGFGMEGSIAGFAAVGVGFAGLYLWSSRRTPDWALGWDDSTKTRDMMPS